MRAFRLLPADTKAAPELMAHLGRAGIVQRADGWGYRFDPAAYGERNPHDNWSTMARIQAPTLVVRAELSSVLTAEMGERMLRLIPSASLAVVPGAYHHLTLDAPEAFVAVLTPFLKEAVGG